MRKTLFILVAALLLSSYLSYAQKVEDFITFGQVDLLNQISDRADAIRPHSNYYPDPTREVQTWFVEHNQAQPMWVTLPDNRLSSIELEDSCNSPTGYIEEERKLRKKINDRRGLGNALFGIVTDTHYAPTMGSTPGKYLGDNNKLYMEKHAKVASLLSQYVGADWLGHCGDILSGENYTDKDLLLSDMNRIFSLFRISNIPFVYSIAHHELYFNGECDDMGNRGGPTRQEIWDIGGGMESDIDYEKHYGSEFNGTDNGYMYYYFDNPEKKLRVININTVDGGLVHVGYEQLIWVRDCAIKSTPEGFGIIIIGHIPPSADLFDYESATFGMSTYNPNKDFQVNGLDLNSILNQAIDDGYNVIGYLCGHGHYDNVCTLSGAKYPIIMITCDIPSKVGDSNVLGDYNAYSRVLDDISEYAIDFFITDVKNDVVYVYRFGAGYDRVIHVRPVEVNVGQTLDLTSVVGTSNDYKSLNENIATLNGGVVHVESVGQTQVIFFDVEKNTKYFFEIKGV